MVSFVVFRDRPQWRLVLLGWLLVQSRLAAQPQLLVTLDGPARTAQLVAVDGDHGVFRMADGESMRLARDQVVRWGSLATTVKPHLVLLADRSLLPGRVVHVDEQTLSFSSSLWGDLDLPRTLVRAIVWQLPTTGKQRAQLFDRLLHETSPEQLFLLAYGDQLRGELLRDDGELSVSASGTTISLDRDRVMAWRNRDVPDRALPAAHVIGLRDGSLLFASQFELENRLQLRLRSGVSLTSLEYVRPVAESLIVYWRPANRRVSYLSDMPTLGHKQIPFLGTELPWTWHADQNVLGQPLSCSGNRFAKGIGMHSTSRIAFDLQPDHVQFQAELGLDDSAGGRGSVVYRVLTTDDNRSWTTRFQSDIVRGGDPLIPVRVDLQPARRVALVVDYADEGDVLDRANWIGARLVTAPAPAR